MQKASLKKLISIIAIINIAYFLLAYIVTLGSNFPLISPDETRYAEIAREMINTGNWVVPKLLGINYFEKPVMVYWMNVFSELTFGYNAFAVRFSSAISVGITALIIYLFISKISTFKLIAALSALIYLGFGFVYGVGTFAVLDSQLTMFITASLVLFYAAWASKTKLRLNLLLAAFGVLVGCAFMAKGFLAFAVVVATIAPFLIWQGQWKRIFTLCWVPLIFAIAISLPWSLEVYYKAPDFWRYFFWVENYGRFFDANAAGMSAQYHPEPFWFFIPVLLVGMLPWTIHIPSAVRGYFKKKAFKEPVFRYLACWIIFQTLFFTSSSGKLATYFLPIFPALAILLAYGLYHSLEVDKKQFIFDITNKLFAFIILIAGIGFAIFCILSHYYKKLPGLYNHSYYAPLFIIIVIIVIFLILYASWKSKSGTIKILLFGLSYLIIFVVRPEITPDAALINGNVQGQFIESVAKDITPETSIVVYPNMMHAVAWYLKRSNLYLWQNPGELEYFVNYYHDQNRFIPNNTDLKAFIEKHKNSGGVVLFARGDYTGQLPVKPSYQKYKDKLFFAKFD